MDTDIILMDEPFSALDPLIREHLQNELLDLQDKLNKTIVFVSHDLNEALKLGNQIVIMKDSLIMQSGAAEDILFHPANDYVRKFVSNINPLTALCAGVIMKPIKIEDDTVKIDKLEINLNLNSAPISCIFNGKNLAISDNLEVDDNQVLIADYNCWMYELIDVVRQSPHPVLVVKNSALVGFISQTEIYGGLTLVSNH